MKKIIALILTAVMVLAVFCSCGSDSSENFTGDPSKPSEGSQSSISNETVLSDDDGLKIVKTYRLELETLAFDKASELIASAAEALGGYISESSEKNTSITEDTEALQYATYTVRIPADKTEEYLDAIEAECNILRSSLTTEDITDSYYDYQAQLDSLKIQEERLTEIVEQTTSLDYLITLEDKLAQIRTEINALNSKLQLMDKSVNYSYVYLTLSEVKELLSVSEESYWQRVSNAFAGAISTFTAVMSEIFIGLLWILPFLLLGAVIAIVIISVERKKKNRRRNQNPSDKDSAPSDTEEKK